MKGVTGEISDEEAARVFQPVVVKLDDQVQLGLEAGRTENGMVAVFFPGSPDVRSGALAFVEPGRVDKLDATLKDFNSVFTTLGQRRIKGLP